MTETSTPTPTQSDAEKQAEQLKAERDAQTKAPTAAQRKYLEQGTAPAAKITPTTFQGEQPPGGHPQDPTSKDSVGSKAEL